MTIHFRPPASRPCFPQQFPDSRLNAPLRAEQLVRHVRETGALIGQLPKQRGKRTDKEPGATDATKFYVDSGIAKSTAMRWQSLATHITDTAFDEAIERIKADDESTISLSAFYGIVKAVRRQTKEREREARRDENRAIVEAAPDPVAIGARFTSLVIDPPWDWGDEGDADQLGRARPQYATMPFAAIKALPVDKLADRDAHLYLWITNRSLPGVRGRPATRRGCAGPRFRGFR